MLYKVTWGLLSVPSALLHSKAASVRSCANWPDHAEMTWQPVSVGTFSCEMLSLAEQKVYFYAAINLTVSV